MTTQMNIRINAIHLAAAVFQDADDAWSRELTRLFGRDACNARYEKRGRGQIGSALHRLHEARECARQGWEARTGLKTD
jgi:hypothetical protein